VRHTLRFCGAVLRDLAAALAYVVYGVSCVVLLFAAGMTVPAWPTWAQRALLAACGMIGFLVLVVVITAYVTDLWARTRRYGD
jgi:hypothetical protein